MKVYTYSEARQQLAGLLERARCEGVVRIRRRDGQTFVLQPEKMEHSGFDVVGLDLGLSREEIVALVRDGRERLPVGLGAAPAPRRRMRKAV